MTEQLQLNAQQYKQAQTANLLYQRLTHLPEDEAAAAQIIETFSDPRLIRDNRYTISRYIDEWDDRLWQHRRRLALSFSMMSLWEDQHWWHKSDIIPGDVRLMLQEGRDQLMQDYLLGHGQGSEMAWYIFQEAIQRTQEPYTAMMWVGYLYAHRGYFAESVDVLESCLAQYPEAYSTRRLWAEARWWRDHQHHIPWIPPPGLANGRRFCRIMSQNNPDFVANPSIWMHPLEYLPPNAANLPHDFPLPQPLPATVTAHLNTLLTPSPSPPPAPSLVDWGYLDALAEGNIDSTMFPEWAQYMLLEIDDPQEEISLKQFLLSYLANPPVPGDTPPTNHEEDD